MEDKLTTMPNMNLSIPEQKKESDLIKSEKLVGYYDEVMKDIKDDREELNDYIKIFSEMVVNDGDATSSSKEALVNLLKLKSEAADKKTKVIDLLTRAFLKEKDTFPRYLAATQNNSIKITDSPKGRLIKSIIEEEKAKKT